MVESADRPKPLITGDLSLLGLTVFWGSTFPAVRFALQTLSPQVFLLARFSVGALSAALLARSRLVHRPSLKAGVALGALLYAGFSLQTMGLRLTTSTRSAFITSMSVVLVPPLAFVLFRKTFHVANYLGVLIATLGLAILTAPGSDGAKGLLAGDLLTLGCAATFSLHIVLADRWASGIYPTATAAVQSMVTALLAAAFLPFETCQWEPSGAALAVVGYTGVLGSAMALSVQLWGQARTTAIRAALIFALEPVFAVIFATAFAGDPVSTHELVGGCLVILGVVIGEVAPRTIDRWRSASR